jgi:hypothetical protein
MSKFLRDDWMQERAKNAFPIQTKSKPALSGRGLILQKHQFSKDFGGRDRDRAGGLLVANEVVKFIRRGAATTYFF